ncbi:MAG: S9 family peptidase [Robiginitomaculum sp.]|nr:S9 family peptidase [Robiginitomaculum sp.]
MRTLIFILGIMVGFGPWVHAHSAPRAESFGELPRIYDAAISPDAKQIAVFINMGGEYGISIMNIDKINKGKPRVVGLGKRIKPQWIKWVNNDRVLISLWKSEKIARTPVTTGFIYTLDVNSMKGKYLIVPEDKIRQYNNDVVDFLQDDPDHILMSFSDTNVFAPDIKKVNVKTGKYKTVKRGKKNIQQWYTDLRGEPRIGQGLLDRSTEKWNLIIRDANGKKWRYADEFPGLNVNVDIHGFTSDPNELVIGSYQGKETLGLYVYSLSAKKIVRKLFHNDDYDVGDLVLSADGKSIAGVQYVADTKETVLFGKYANTLEFMRAKYNGYTVDYVDQSQDSEIVLFNITNAYDPGALMMLNTSTNKVSLLSLIRPRLPASEMGEVMSVSYTARDGFKIPAYVTLPPSITSSAQLKNLPFVILPHGGPYARTSKRFDYFSQFFVSRGFAVLQMNFRGSEGYGKSFKEAGRKNWVLMQEDVEDGARWLIKKGYADPTRMCIAGWSYGGYAALMGAIKNPELYACAVSMAGVTDLQDMIRDINKYRFGRIGARNFVLKGFESKDDIKANSPVKLAKEFTVPLFLAHGTLDQRVHYDQFTRMKRALKKSSAKVTFMSFKDEDHFLSNQDNRQRFFVGLDEFLEKHLGTSEAAP